MGELIRSVVIGVVGASLWLVSASARAELNAPIIESSAKGVWPDGSAAASEPIKVAVLVTVGADGVPRDAEPEADAPRALAEAAREAALAYRFKPATDDGSAVGATAKGSDPRKRVASRSRRAPRLRACALRSSGCDSPTAP